jgi:GntR family transcriptional repressor for pyruvate dehydrogenase complex
MAEAALPPQPRRGPGRKKRSGMRRSGSTPIRREPALADQVADHLAEQVERGELTPGSPLPSEAELCRRFEVSRTVVREALARLKYDGLLESKKGGRTRVSRDVRSRAFRLTGAGREKSDWTGYLYELRAVVESEAAALAARRADPDDLASIKRHFHEVERAVECHGEIDPRSIEFHQSLMAASHNPHLARFVEWLGAQVWTMPPGDDGASSREVVQQVQNEHKKLIEAIASGDEDLARKLSKDHVLAAARRRGIKVDI